MTGSESEADVSVVLNAAEMNAQDLYVAITRGSKALVIWIPSPISESGTVTIIRLKG
jgi:hypothetical protein